MPMQAKRCLSRMSGTLVGLALALAGGCAGFERVLEPGGLSGLDVRQQGQRVLAEPAIPAASSYVSANAHRTMAAPVSLHVPDRETDFTVNSGRPDVFRSPYVVASFPGGAIVEREFGKVLEANFRVPVGGEAPVAELGVRIVWVKTSQPSDSKPISVSMRLNVEVVKGDGSETAYSDAIEVSATAAWKNRSQVPEAFYAALSDAIARFLDGWDRSGGPDAVARWVGDADPGAVPPELLAFKWEAAAGKGGIQRGRCTIACNDWEKFRAKQWAEAQIAVACRTKLGNIEQERVRVVYDTENDGFDRNAGTWTFAFRCFARCERVLDYDAATGTGTVIGDLGLMKMGAGDAAEALKAYVHEEMDSHAGMVTSGHRKSEARVRFDDYRTDKTYNLIYIDFRLLR